MLFYISINIYNKKLINIKRNNSTSFRIAHPDFSISHLLQFKYSLPHNFAVHLKIKLWFLSMWECCFTRFLTNSLRNYFLSLGIQNLIPDRSCCWWSCYSGNTVTPNLDYWKLWRSFFEFQNALPCLIIVRFLLCKLRPSHLQVR